MKIAQNTVVTMDFMVTDLEGQVIDTSNGSEPITVLIGHNQVVPGLEDQLLGHAKGDQVDVVVPPERGYGERSDQLLQKISKDLFAGMELNVGDSFLADTDQGKRPIIVKEIMDNEVLVDGNHPLAGMTLKFLVDILDVRQATDSEIEHGHVHGEGDTCGCGHDHDEDHCCCGHHHHDDDHDEGHHCCGHHHHHHDEDHQCCGRHKHDEEHHCCHHHDDK